MEDRESRVSPEKSDLREDLKLNNILFDLILIVFGFAGVWGSSLIHSELYASICFGAGLAASIGGTLLIMWDMLSSDFLIRSTAFLDRAVTYMEELQERKSLLKDERGIAYVWIVGVIGIAVTIIVWFPLGWVVYDIMDTMLEQFSYPAVATGTIELMQWVIAWTPAILIIGLLLWMIVNSFKVEYPSQPYM
jgi:hypothetical protein